MPAISQAFRCFDEVARRGSVRKAAVTLHLTAAAVNQQILNLEAQVGVPLFDRLPRGMQLTTAASISSGTGEELLRGVAQGEIDVAYCLRRPPPPGVQEVRAWPQPLGAVMAPGHPLATEPRLLRLRDCVDYPLILMAPGMELRSMLEQMDSAALHQQRPLVETSSVPMVRRLVAGSTALGFLVPDNVAEDVTAGRLLWRPLHDAGAQLPGCLYQRIGYTKAAAMRLFLDELERVADEMRAGFETGVSWSLKDLAT